MRQDLIKTRRMVWDWDDNDNFVTFLHNIKRVYYYQTWSSVILFFEVKESKYIHYCKINTNYGRGSQLPKIMKKLRKHVFFNIVRDLTTSCSISGRSMITYTGKKQTTVKEAIQRELVSLIHDENIIRSYIAES